jgi:hypothetical protein
MGVQLIDENKIRSLPDEERFSTCEYILKNEADESKRWDAVWLIGELAENKNEGNPMFDKVAEIMGWVVKNDNNGVVKHEACYQIAARNMRKIIPILVDAALNDTSMLTKHEALESLGLMRAFEVEDLIRKATEDPSIDVRETAEFILKRFDRMKSEGKYKPTNIL